MDRALLTEHLLKAEQHVAQSEERIRRQRELVEHLATAGLDTIQAEYLLLVFEQALALHKSDRDRLRAELGRSTESRR